MVIAIVHISAGFMRVLAVTGLGCLRYHLKISCAGA